MQIFNLILNNKIQKMKKVFISLIITLITGQYASHAQVRHTSIIRENTAAKSKSVVPAVTANKLATTTPGNKFINPNIKRLNTSSAVLLKRDFNLLGNGEYSIVSMKLPGNTTKKDYYVQKWGSKLILNGDIIVRDFAVSSTKSLTIDDEHPLFGKDELYRWPGGVVPVSLDNSVFEGDNYLTIKSALDFFNFNTGIIFKEHTNEDEWLFIKVIKDDGSGAGGRSDVGRQRNGSNILELIDSSFNKGTVMHELMHALGVYHEQGRPDRDNFIDIHWDKIREDAKNNFQIESDGTMRSNYDYCSIMHYPSINSFSKQEGSISITCKSNGVASECPDCMGAQTTLSKMDIAGLDEYYREIGISRFPSGIPFTYSKLPIAGCIGVADQQIKTKWIQYKKVLGNCQTGAISMGIFNTTYVQFDNGVIYHSPHGVFAVYGAIYQLFKTIGTGKTGFPISDEEDISKDHYSQRIAGYTRVSKFEKGVIIWGPNKNALFQTNDVFNKPLMRKTEKTSFPPVKNKYIPRGKSQTIHH